jgi:outer membrane lipoprotein SlyB
MYLSRLCQCAFILVAIMGCATEHPVSSTEGTTLVQAGYVIDVRAEIRNSEHGSTIAPTTRDVPEGVLGSNICGSNGSTVTGSDGTIAGGYVSSHPVPANAATATGIAVRLDDGHERWYPVAVGESFRVGERVKVTTHYGVSTVSH